MTQQVNLYQPIFRKQKRKFSAVAMLQATTAMILGIGLMYGYTTWQVRQLRADAIQVDKQLSALTKQLDDVTRQFSERFKSKDLEARIQEVESQIAEKQRLQELLGTAQFNVQGFSDYLIAFARQHTPGVWLTSLDITGAAQVLALSGRSINPELVPRYLQRLSAEKRLNGIEFHVFQMSRPETAGAKGADVPYVEFLARTGGEGPAADAPPKAAP